MYKKVLIGILSFPLFAYADDVAGLVNKFLAEDPAQTYEIGDVKGPVKQIIMTRGDNPSPVKIVSFDKEQRIISIERQGWETSQFFYKDHEKFPQRMKSMRPFSAEDYSETFYNRDKYGNILTMQYYRYHVKSVGSAEIVDSITTTMTYRQLNSGVIEVNFDRDAGIIAKHYKDGLLVKQIAKNMRGFNINRATNTISDITIPVSTDIYHYEFDKKAHQPSLMYHEVYHGDELSSIDWDAYSRHSDIIKRFSSTLGNTKTGNGYVWVNYKFDKHHNWIARKHCKVQDSWDKYHSCEAEKRKIRYY